MDLLSDALLSLRIVACSVGVGHCHAPWGFSMGRNHSDYVVAHSVAHGSCWLSADALPPTLLEAGDSVLALRGAAYSMVSGPEARPLDFMEYWRGLGLARLQPGTQRSAPVHFRMGRPGADATLILSFAYLIEHLLRSPLLSALPDVIVVRARASKVFPWISQALGFLSEEQAQKPGYAATAAHLAELVFISLLRAHAVADAHTAVGWMRGAGDPRIGLALQAMHGDMRKPWDIHGLAAVAASSRATFLRRFTKLMGQSPMHYLAALRMNQALVLLEQGMPVARVADTVGYASERTFRHAFKRHFGAAPSRYVKAGRAGEGQ